MNKFLTLAATSLAALQMQVVAQETRPNIIYIMSDDHALQAISAYGSRLAKVLPSIELQMKGFAWIIVALPILSVLRAGLVL